MSGGYLSINYQHHTKRTLHHYLMEVNLAQAKCCKRYKQNAVIGDLHRSKRIFRNIEMEIKVIKCKSQNTDYPPKFLNSVINQFLTPKNNDSFIIPADLFEESKPFILVEMKYRVMEKTKMLPNILLKNSRHLTITVMGLQLNG